MIAVGIAVTIALILWCGCVVSGRADDATEAVHRARMGSGTFEEEQVWNKRR